MFLPVSYGGGNVIANLLPGFVPHENGERTLLKDFETVTVPHPGQTAPHANVRPRNSMWGINILDLPPRLYSDICDDLNLHNDMGRDWRGLAEEFGRTIREVEVLKFRSPRDPCDALLQDWAASAHAPSIESLVEMLRRLGRLDVIRRIEEYIQAQ